MNLNFETDYKNELLSNGLFFVNVYVHIILSSQNKNLLPVLARTQKKCREIHTKLLTHGPGAK